VSNSAGGVDVTTFGEDPRPPTSKTQTTPGWLAIRVRRYLPAVAIFIGGLAMWETAVRVFNIQGFLLPKPTEIATTFVDEFPTVVSAGWFTMKEALGGFLIGSVLAMSLALLTARWTIVRDGLMPFAIAINATPIIALAPIMNNWFGVTSPLAKMSIVAVIVFFPVMINMVRGLTEVDESTIELMRSYGATPLQLLTRVRVPNSFPFLFSAFKVGTTLSVIAAIVSEYFGGSREALGIYISQQAALFHFAEAWSAIVVASVFGILFYLVVALVERAVMPWHASIRTITD